MNKKNIAKPIARSNPASGQLEHLSGVVAVVMARIEAQRPLTLHTTQRPELVKKAAA